MVETTLSPLAPESFPSLPALSGVRLGTIAAGIKYKDRPDVTFVTFPEGTVVAGVFTRSLTPGAPILWCRDALRAGGGRSRALVVNAGNSNVFTGEEGYNASGETARAAARLVGCAPEDVMVSSTGVIGVPLPYEKIVHALPAVALSEESWEDAARGIMTTDTFPKGATATAVIDGKTVTINGIAKGSGMIEPNMATMLAYVATDAAIGQHVLDALLRDVNERSFNAITVDSDTSTSDTLLLFATGTAGNAPVDDSTDPRLADFRTKLEAVMGDLARQVVRDGEGATKFITVLVTGAETDAAARKVAKTIANSPLVKTAIAGEDANWGRIVAAVGKSYEKVDPRRLSVRFGGQQVTDNGRVRDGYDEGQLTAHLKGQEIDIAVDLGVGDGCSTVWTCDLTHGYIDINADYRS
ncbi:bifunctional glutamate N-acetyltransferase/amino-acid acetyltransferase ArgJ [Iodidimonas sp. SYSU 1G8]|uniref:bifunctional glutamate N-acetyltransferase/amino-acid acetyltransferase ArgJ n=1 Tax=Iodidimonas sp. SYSU 1G8 TaxID=3133967 RepID=UPI0031FE61F7